MAFYQEIATVNDVRAGNVKTTSTTDDAFILDVIRSVCNDLAAIAGQEFVPRIQTRYYDPTRDIAKHDRRTLTLDRPLLAVTTLTNGDGTAISGSSYVTNPRNETPYYSLTLLGSSGVSWRYTTNAENALSLAGVWGYHTSYTDAWNDSTATLAAAIVSTTATTFTCTTGLIKAGMLFKIDSEIFYASSVATAASDTVTCVRGVNGSTAATHLISTSIYLWAAHPSAVWLVREIATARYKARENPTGETIVLEGNTFVVPKDQRKAIEYAVATLGLRRH